MDRLTDWERSWLAWARPIVRTSMDRVDHYLECRNLLGAAEYPHTSADPASDPTLRWPGFVGADWIPGRGVLCVGSVHADFTKDGRNTGARGRIAIVAEMADANRRWRDRPDSDSSRRHYLDATRAAYTALIPGWARDSGFALVREELGDLVSEIAWTNLAHCRARPKQVSEYTLQRRCSGIRGTFPIGELIGALRPVAVLACVAPLDKEHGRGFRFQSTDGWAPPVFAFNGFDGSRHDEPLEVWSVAVAAEIRALRKTGTAQ